MLVSSLCQATEPQFDKFSTGELFPISRYIDNKSPCFPSSYGKRFFWRENQLPHRDGEGIPSICRISYLAMCRNKHLAKNKLGLAIWWFFKQLPCQFVEKREGKKLAIWQKIDLETVSKTDDNAALYLKMANLAQEQHIGGFYCSSKRILRDLKIFCYFFVKVVNPQKLILIKCFEAQFDDGGRTLPKCTGEGETYNRSSLYKKSINSINKNYMAVFLDRLTVAKLDFSS